MSSPIDMKLHVLVLYIIALRINISTCLSTYSAFTCALGRRSPAVDAATVKKLLNITDEGATRSADGYVSFYLYTRENRDGQLIILGDSNSVWQSSFSGRRPTKLIIPGYLADRTGLACTLPKDAFLATDDYNVIIVDWYAMMHIWGLIPIDYWTVAGYVGEVGSYVAEMINFLENHGMNPETTTLIGHSLGAHVMGIAGYNTRNKVNYIVGLDPALPSFESRNPGERLSIQDAVTVEVIHTNEGDCGMSSQIGHFDFYPNGGSKQPGCVTNACSHSRAYELYAESIRNKGGLSGRKCADCNEVKQGRCNGDVALMGWNGANRKDNGGMYHLETRASPPYALGS